MTISYLEDARHDGHDTEMHKFVKGFVDDGVAHFCMTYGTTQLNSARGRGRRNIIIKREGANRETDLGADDDTRPGWWATQDGEEKFFLSARILDIDMISHDDRYGRSACLCLLSAVPTV